MIKHIWSVLCQSSIVDSQTNNVSLLNSLERIQVSVDPGDNGTGPITVPINFELVSSFIREKGDKPEVKVRVVRIGPRGKEIDDFSMDSPFKKDSYRMRNNIRINGLLVTTSGLYTFKVQVKTAGQKGFKTVAELPLEVEVERSSNSE